MGLFDKVKKLVGGAAESDDDKAKALGTVTAADHMNSDIKERPDLCKKISDIPVEETVKRDGKINITFKGWQVCNVEERAHDDDRRLGYLKLFITKNDKFVCQRMELIDNEEKRYTAATVDDFPAIRCFFGEDKLAIALYVMLERVSRDW